MTAVTDWVDDAPGLVATALVALVLVAESGLLVGLVLPAASLVLGLGVLAGAGVVPVPVAVLTVASATVLGAALGHHAASHDLTGDPLRPGGVLTRLLPRRALDVLGRATAMWTGAIARRPVRAAALAQGVAGARTLAPRLAASAGIPLTTVLRGAVPTALVWSATLVTAGAAAGAALPLVRGAVAVVGIPVVITATWLLLRRRSTGPAPRHPEPAASPRVLLEVALLLAASAVALLTLAPAGTPEAAWGAPASELRWYATGLDSGSTLLQLMGNLLLVPLTVLAVLRWPRLGQAARLSALPAAAAVGIELLQWGLPLGRVVSPADAVLNATGALVAGLAVARWRSRSIPARRCEVGPDPGTAAGSSPRRQCPQPLPLTEPEPTTR